MLQRGSKILNLMGLATIACLFGSAGAYAAINLKKVQITDGSQVELIFDGKVNPGQIKTEFVRDNIQLSLDDVSVYPAKVSMVSGADLTKVFAYQYAPKLVRARFTVKGDAAQYQNRLQVKANGKIVTVRILGGKADQVATSSASADRAANSRESRQESSTASAEEAAQAPARKESELNNEEKQLLDRVLATDESAKEKEPVAKKEKKSPATSGPLATGKPLPSPMRSIGVMLFIVGLLGIFLMFMKRLKGGKVHANLAKSKGLSGLLGKLSGSLAQKNMIEVISTHNLGPKKSIVMVKIQNRMLVLGMTNDAVNLITEFKAPNDSGIEEEEDLAESIDVSDFASNLRQFENAPASGPTFSSPKKSSALGDLAAAALGVAKPKTAAPSSPAVTQAARAATNAYQNAGTHAPAGATAAGSPAFAQVVKEESTRTSIRAQIKNRVGGMKQL